MNSIIKKIFISLLSAIVLLIMFLLFIVNTHTGLLWAVTLFKNFTPGTLRIKQIDGTLIGPLSIKQLHYQTANTNIKIKSLELKWRPRALLSRNLSITKFHVNGASITVATSKKSPKIHTEFKFPLSLNLKNIDLKNITFKLGNHPSILINRIIARLNTQKENFNTKLCAKIKTPKPLILTLQLDGTEKKYYLTLHALSNNFNLNMEGHGNKKQFILNELTGKVKNRKIKGNAQINYENNSIHKLSINLNAGNAKIFAQGSITDQWALNWEMTVPDMNELFSNTKGSISAKGQITGAFKQPNVQIKLIANNLLTHELAVKRFNANVDIRKAGLKTSSISITGQQLRWFTHTLAQLNVNINGQLNQHNIDFILTDKKIKSELQLQGSWSQPSQLWQAELKKFDINEKNLGIWTLTNPVLIKIGAKNGIIPENFCLNNHEQKICLNVQWQNKTIEANFDLVKLRLQSLASLLSKNLKLVGSINLRANAIAKDNKITEATLIAILSPGSLDYTATEILRKFTFKGGTINANINKKGLQANAELGLIANSQFKASLKAPHFDGVFKPHQKIQAQLYWNVPSLRFLEKFIGDVTNVQGKINLDSEIEGTLQEPIIKGQLALTNGQFNVPEADLRIHSIQATLTGKGRQIRYFGKAMSGNGQLTITGQTDLSKKSNFSQFNIAGNDFLVMNTAQFKISLSPNLKLKMQGNRIDLNGVVTIPKANINPPNYHQTVTMPNDVKYVKNNDEPKPIPFNIYSHIRLTLGNDVNMAYMGAKGQLAGKLDVQDEPGKTTLATGRINLLNGVFNAYGQNLTLDPARILYFSSPVNNPILAIHAYRRIRLTGVTGPLSFDKQYLLAGVAVTGTAASPKISFYSEPSGLSQADILSYMIVGRPANKAGGKAELLLKAAMALSSGSNNGSGGLFGQMQKNLGIDITTETEQTGIGPEATQHTAVALGKYLTSHLYVSYGIGVLGGVNIFNLRYMLNKYLSLQSESSSLGSGADLIYNLER